MEIGVGWRGAGRAGRKVGQGRNDAFHRRGVRDERRHIRPGDSLLWEESSAASIKVTVFFYSSAKSSLIIMIWHRNHV